MIRRLQVPIVLVAASASLAFAQTARESSDEALGCSVAWTEGFAERSQEAAEIVARAAFAKCERLWRIAARTAAQEAGRTSAAFEEGYFRKSREMFIEQALPIVMMKRSAPKAK